MRRYSPLILVACACLLGALLLFGDDSYGKLRSLQANLAGERERNDRLEEQVSGLKRQIYGLKRDDRYLERVARNELGLARPGELIFLFEGNRIVLEGEERVGRSSRELGEVLR
jgi:cell division protein FtsB